jgi:hypothetical protein
LSIAAGWGINVDDPIVNVSWTGLQFQIGHDVAIRAAHLGIPSLVDVSWTIRNPIPPFGTDTDGNCISKIGRFRGTVCRTIRPDYVSAWKTLFTDIKPFIANGTYVGVFLGDETMWDGVSLANLTVMTDLIKTDWPDAITMISEAQVRGSAPTLTQAAGVHFTRSEPAPTHRVAIHRITSHSGAQDLVHCNWNRLGEPFFGDDDCFPDTLDWFAYDYYCTAFSARVRSQYTCAYSTVHVRSDQKRE